MPAAESPAPTSSPPRAFAQGVGLLFQTVGVVLFLSSCCVCSLSGLWDRSIMTGDESPAVVTLSSLMERPAAAGAMVTVMASTLAGLALAGFGLGLQADRRGSATGALASALATLVLLIVAGAAVWVGSGPWAMRLWNLALLVLLAVLAGFALAAWREVRREPPPEDVDVVPAGQKIPYSWYHDDPPDVRLEREIAAKQARLQAEQRELEAMREELEKKRREEGGYNEG